MGFEPMEPCGPSVFETDAFSQPLPALLVQRLGFEPRAPGWKPGRLPLTTALQVLGYPRRIRRFVGVLLGRFDRCSRPSFGSLCPKPGLGGRIRTSGPSDPNRAR